MYFPGRFGVRGVKVPLDGNFGRFWVAMIFDLLVAWFLAVQAIREWRFSIALRKNAHRTRSRAPKAIDS
jgi:hypothetical protein